MAGRSFVVAMGVCLVATPSIWSSAFADDTDAEITSTLRRELIAWRKVLDTTSDDQGEQRAAAIAEIRSVSDPRAVPSLGDLWDKENERSGSFLVRGYYIEALINIGNRPAFLKLAEVSVEDLHGGNRQRAASWIGAQDNRDDAIPIYTRYLKSKQLFHQALSALGYAQIATKGKQPPNRELVAALIDNLVTVTPVRKRVTRPYVFDTRRTARGSYEGGWGTERVWVTEYETKENSTAHDFLYAYCLQDHGYDQKAWRTEVLKRSVPSKSQER